MIEKSDIEIFKGKPVCIKVPHKDGWPSTFQHYGVLKRVNDDSVMLRTKRGLVTIRLDFILEITNR